MSSYSVRPATARDAKARDVVKQLVDDQDATVRDAAEWALKRLGQTSG